ncbi:unnamed protein product, partial [Ectocarpus fasciculatus]
LLASPCEKDVAGNGTSPDCLLENASVEIRRVVLGKSPASGTFRLGLVSGDDDAGSTSVAGTRTTEPIPFDATADELHAAVVGLPGGQNAKVTVAPNARAEYGFGWGVTLHDNGNSSVELVEVNIDDPGPWCADGVTGPAAAGTPCEFPFAMGQDGRDVHFSCAGAVGSSQGWCSTIPTFNDSRDWGGCVRCEGSSLLSPPTIHVASLRRSFRLRGEASQVSQALSEIVYHPRALWNAWLGGHDEVSAYWYDENSLDGSERLSGAKARSVSQVFVAPVNDPPTIGLGKEARLVHEGEELLLEDAEVLDPDLADRPRTPVRVELEAMSGTLAFGDSAGLTFTSGSRDPHSSQRLVVTGPLKTVQNAMRQVYYRPLPVSPAGTTAEVRTTSEVQRVELTAPLVPMVQSVTTSTAQGYIEGNFTLSVDCSAFFEEVDERFADVDAVNQTNINSSATAVESPPIAADAPATGNGSMETSVRELLSECVSLAWDRANVLAELSNATSVSVNSSSTGNFTRDTLPHRGATAVVSRGEPDVHGSLSWTITLMDVPHSFPALEVGANNLTGAGVGLDGSPYVFDGVNLSGTPSISIDIVQAQSSLSGPTGTFTLTATPGEEATGPIPTSASGDEVAAALTSLSDVGAVQVSAGPILASPPKTPALGQYWEITFLQSGSPIQIGDLPLLEARGVGFDAEGTALRVSEVTKGRAPRDSVTISVNDLGNVGDGGALEATAAWNITIVPKHVAPVVQQVDDGTVHPEDFLRTFEGTVLQLPSLQVSHFPAFEAAGDDSYNDLQYLVRVSCSRGTVKPTSSAAGQGLAVTMTSTTATLLTGKLKDLNRALSNLGYYAPRRYRGVDEVEVAARVAGVGVDGGWGATKLYVFVDGVNDPPELSAPRSATSKGATPTLVGGISVTDDDTTGIITITVEAARGLVSFPQSHRLKHMGGPEDVTVSNSSIVAYGQLQDIADVLSALTYTGQSSEFSGIDTITLKVVDAGGLTASRIVKVDVEASSPPKITRARRLASLPTSPVVDEDGELSLDALHISVSDSAVESIVQVEIVCTNGAVSLPLSEQEPELWTSTDKGQGVVVAGNTNRVNRALRSLVYRPDADVWGSDQLSIVARARNDNAIGSSSGWNTVAGIESIVILINPVNDPPTIHFPARLAGGVLPLAFAGEVLPLGGIVVHDADAGEPGGSQLVSVNVSAVGEGSTVSLAMSNSTVQGRLPGVLFLEGSAEGMYPSIAFRAPLHLANSALDLLQFWTPFRQPSGLYNVSVTVSDHGNWGKGEEEIASANVTIDVRYQDDPLADAGRGGLVQWDIPDGALSVDEDAHLHDLGIALRADDGTVSSANDMWVDASLEVDHGLIQMPKSGAQVNGETVFEVVRYGPGSLTVSGAVADVSVALADSSYTPEPNFHGVETLVLSVREHFGERVTNASVDVVVFSRPDPPTIAVDIAPEGITAEVGSRLVLHGVEVQHVDALDEYASGTVTLRAYSTTKGGTIAMNKTQPGLWVYTEETGGALVARGSVENLQIALDSGALEYLPSAGYDGLDVVSLSVSADSQYGVFGGKSSALQEAIYGGSENATAELHINVIPALASAAVIFGGGPLFRTVEGSGIEIAGIRVRAPGRRNTSDVVLSVSFETAHGSVTVREAARTRVIVEGKGRSAMSLTGKELDINMALEGAIFNGGPFYNGVADVKVEVLSSNGDTLAEAVLYVVVEAVNDAPSVICPTWTIMVDEDAGPTNIPGVYVTDPDVHETKGSMIEVRASVDPPEAGGLSLSQPGASVFPSQLPGPESAPVLSLSSELDQANTILEGLHFSPSADFFGSVAVTFEVNDGGASGLGGGLSASSSMSLEVTPVNDPPIIAAPREHRRSGGRGPLRIVGVEINDVDGITGETLSVSITAETGSITVDYSPETLISTISRGRDASVTGVSVTGLLPDVRKALSHVWFVLPSEGWEGGSIVTFSAEDGEGATGSAECVVVVSDSDVPPTITTTNDTFFAGQGIQTSLVGLSVADSVEDAAILSGFSPPTFTVLISADTGGVGLFPVPPGLSTVPGSDTALKAAAAITAGEGLRGIFGTPRPTLSFRGTLSAVNAALEALVYLSANGSTALGNTSVTVEVARQGRSTNFSVRHELTVGVLPVNQPPEIKWNATNPNLESPEVGGFSLRALEFVDDDLVYGGTLGVELKVLAEGDSLVVRSDGRGLEFSRGSADGVPSPILAFRGNATAVASAISASSIILNNPGLPRALVPAVRVAVEDDDGGESSQVIEVYGSHVNSPPHVTIKNPQQMALKEGGVLERVGELAGVEVHDADVEDSTQGFLEVNVSTSHRAVLEVQIITTSATSVHPVQTVTTRSTYNDGYSTVEGMFNLTMDLTGLCDDCGVEETKPIWHDAVGNEEDVHVGLGSGSESGESIQAKLEALPSLQALGVSVHCQRPTGLGLEGGREWRVTFLDAPASLPMMQAIGDLLVGDDPFIEVAYAVKGNSLSGSFALSLGGYQTGIISYDAEAEHVAAELEALPSVTAVAVTMLHASDPQGGRQWTVTFFDALEAGGDVPLMEVDGRALGGRGAAVRVVESVRGIGTAEVWEVETSAAHQNLIVFITLTGALQAKGHFTLGLDYGGRQAWTRPIHPRAVGPVTDEDGGFWSFGGVPGKKRGESVEARLLSLENWAELGPAARVTVKRVDSANGNVATWAITFFGTPQDLDPPTIQTTKLAGGAVVSAEVAATHNHVQGFFYLSYGSAVTPPLAHDSSGAEIAAALNALESLHSSDSGMGVVTATRLQSSTLEGGQRWSIAFLSDPEVSLNLSATGTSTTGLSGGSARASATLVRRGGRGAILRLVDLGGAAFGLPGYTTGERLALRGSPDAITTMLASLSYSPRSGWNGGVDILLRAYDGGFTGAGGAQSGWGKVSATVNAVNNPPELLWCGSVLNSGGAVIDGVDEDAPFRLVDFDCGGGGTPATPVLFDHTDLGGPGMGLTVHDSDGEGSRMQVEVSAKHGFVTLSGETAGLVSDGVIGTPAIVSGTSWQVNAGLRSLVYVSAEDWHGWDKMSITVTDLGDDSLQTPTEPVTYYLHVSVAAVNDAPVFTSMGFEEVTLVDAESSLGDEQTSALLVSAQEDTVRIISGVSIWDVDTMAERALLNRPDGFFGTVSTDGMGNGAELLAVEPKVSLSLSCSYGSLGLVGEYGGLEVVEGELDSSGQILSVTGALSNINAALMEGIAYTPSSDWNGIDVVEVAVDDRGNGGKTLQGANGSLTSKLLLAVEVAAVNDPPTFTVPTADASSSYLTAEEDRVGVVGIDHVGWLDENILDSTIISTSSIVLEDADAVYAPDGTTLQPPQSRWTHESSTSSPASVNDTVEVTVQVSHGGVLPSGARSEVMLVVVSPANTSSVASSGFAAEMRLGGPVWAVADALKGMLYRTDLNWNSWVGSGGNQVQPVVTEEISLQATDSEGSTAAALLRFVVLPENDPPVLEMASATYNPSRQTHDGLSRVIDSVDLFSVSEDQDLVVPGLSVRDVDLGVDGTSIFGGDPGFVDSGLLEITLFASNGTTSLGAGVSGCTFLVGDGVDDGIMSFRASLGGVKRALAGLTYRGKVDFYGTDDLVVTVDDGGRFGRGPLCEDSSSGDGVEVGGNHPPCPQSDTLTIPIRVLPEPDVPGVYLPQGGLIQTTEDSDLVLEGLAIVERDGFYREGEMEGEITTGGLDANPSDVEDEGAVVFGGTWPGEIRVELSAPHAQLTLSTVAGLTFESGSGYGDEFLAFTGHPGDVNRALLGTIYRGDRHWNTLGKGPNELTIVASNSHAGLGGLEPFPVASTHTLWIEIKAVNDPPRVHLPGQVFRRNLSVVWPDIEELGVAFTHPLVVDEDTMLDVPSVS